MSDPNAPLSNPKRIIEVLDHHGVAYVLVGGVGAQLHGATRQTFDVGVCPAWDKENLGHLAAALRELEAHLRGLPDDLVLPLIIADTLRTMQISNWRTSAGDVDVMFGIPADERQTLNRYEVLRERAATSRIAGCTVYVADLNDIIVSKRVANRPSDREALPELESLHGGSDSPDQGVRRRDPELTPRTSC